VGWVRRGKGQLEIEERQDAGRHAFVLRGELDSATCPSFEAALREACAGAAAEIALDLGGLTFMDSSGLLAVVRGYRMCRAAARGFMVAPGNGAARYLFDACGMLGVAPFLEVGSDRDPTSPGRRSRLPPV
jgi:anti-anti-sigma factor